MKERRTFESVPLLFLIKTKGSVHISINYSYFYITNTDTYPMTKFLYPFLSPRLTCSLILKTYENRKNYART